MPTLPFFSLQRHPLPCELHSDLRRSQLRSRSLVSSASSATLACLTPPRTRDLTFFLTRSLAKVRRLPSICSRHRRLLRFVFSVTTDIFHLSPPPAPPSSFLTLKTLPSFISSSASPSASVLSASNGYTYLGCKADVSTYVLQGFGEASRVSALSGVSEPY